MANLVGKISGEKGSWDMESGKYCFIKYTVYYYIVCKCKYYGRSRVLNTFTVCSNCLYLFYILHFCFCFNGAFVLYFLVSYLEVWKTLLFYYKKTLSEYFKK